MAFLDASWNIDSKKQNLRSFVRIEPTGTMTKPLTTGFFQLSALDIWISDFVRHWILNTEFLLQYLAAHVISALHLGVRFLERFSSAISWNGYFLNGRFLEMGLIIIYNNVSFRG
ncbi:hypothetical protein RhiirB3_528489 [Rhizophagus irregularis]|nr:hypothetical protein RhiirB3_528489 [Rhizophagus irregularis]